MKRCARQVAYRAGLGDRQAPLAGRERAAMQAIDQERDELLVDQRLGRQVDGARTAAGDGASQARRSLPLVNIAGHGGTAFPVML